MKTKRILSALLCLVMLSALLPMAALAETGAADTANEASLTGEPDAALPSGTITPEAQGELSLAAQAT